MKAVVHERYGPPEVLGVTDVERPEPKEDEVLVRVHASTVARTDTGLRSSEYPFTRLFTGIRRPKRTIARVTRRPRERIAAAQLCGR